MSDKIQHNPLSAFRLPAYREIPDVGLFLEQTSKYVTSCLAPDTGIVLTPSMISNYVKQKLIGHPVKKQYGRDLIARLFLISLLKSVLTLDEIRIVLEMLKKRGDEGEVYDAVISDLSEALRLVCDSETGPAPSAQGTKKADAADALLRDTLLTVAHKLSLSQSFSRFMKK